VHDREEPPLARQAFQLVRAAILEGKPGARDDAGPWGSADSSISLAAGELAIRFPSGVRVSSLDTT